MTRSKNSKRAFIRQVSSRLFEIANSRQRARRVPYAGVVFDESEIENAASALYDMFVTRWFSIGKYASQFEERFSRYLGLRYCLLTNSGSSANLLAVGALVQSGLLRQGDEVLTPGTTFPTTVNPLLFYGLKPVLLDIDLPSYTVSVDTLKHASSARTKGILLPHLNGSASYMPAIMEVAEERGWIVIEDCCDALGTRVDGRYAGTFGIISTFSFYAAHHICMGEGGAICSNDRRLVSVARSLRDWGRASEKEIFDMEKGRDIARVGKGSPLPEDYEMRYTYITRGFNLKPIDLQAAIGLAQLRKLHRFSKMRRHNYRFLFKALSEYGGALILPQSLKGVKSNWFVFPIIVKEGASFGRKELVDHLERNGVETRPILAGNILKQPAYRPRDFRASGKLVNSDLIMRRGFFIGVYPGLENTHLRMISKAFRSFFDRLSSDFTGKINP